MEWLLVPDGLIWVFKNCRSCQLRTGNGKLQFTQVHQNWKIEDCKNVAWSYESRFLLQHSDGRVRIRRKEHESMDPSCLVSMVQAPGGGGGVGDIFLTNFGPLSTNWASFKRHSLPEYCCWPCHPFMTTVYPSSNGYFQQDNATCHKAQIISDWFLEPKSLRNVSNTLLNLCYEELRQFWRQKGVQPGTSKVYLIKWPVSVCVCVCMCVYILDRQTDRQTKNLKKICIIINIGN